MGSYLTGARVCAAMLMVIALAIGSVMPTRAEGPWSTFNVSADRFEFTVLTVGDRVLIGGGRHSDPTTHQIVYDDLVHIYDGQTGAWSTAKLSTPRLSMTGATVGGLALFIGGSAPFQPGRPGPQYSDVVDIYDSADDSWSVAHLSFTDSSPRVVTVGTQLLITSFSGPSAGKADVFDSTTRTLAPMEAAQLRHQPGNAGWITANGILLLMRQYQAPGIWNVDEPVDLYDSRRGEWSTLSVPTPRLRAGVAAAGPFIVFAGGDVDGTPVDTIDIYNTATGGWSSGKLSAPSNTAGGVTLGQRALFTGSTVDVFDSATGSWSTTTPPVPLKGDLTVRGSVAVWALSVAWGERDPAPLVAIYDADRDTWQVATLSVPRNDYSIAVAGSRVLFAGGSQSGNGGSRTPKVELTVVDIYDLATGTWSQGQLQRGRETMRTASVADKALFIGGILGCNSCPIGNVGLIVDIYDASAG